MVVVVIEHVVSGRDGQMGGVMGSWVAVVVDQKWWTVLVEQEW